MYTFVSIYFNLIMHLSSNFFALYFFGLFFPDGIHTYMYPLIRHMSKIGYIPDLSLSYLPLFVQEISFQCFLGRVFSKKIQLEAQI